MLFLLATNRHGQQAHIGPGNRETQVYPALDDSRMQALASLVIGEPVRLFAGTRRVPGKAPVNEPYHGDILQNPYTPVSMVRDMPKGCRRPGPST